MNKECSFCDKPAVTTEIWWMLDGSETNYCEDHDMDWNRVMPHNRIERKAPLGAGFLSNRTLEIQDRYDRSNKFYGGHW